MWEYFLERQLSDLDPKLTEHQLRFTCPTSLLDPNDKDRDWHWIVIPIYKKGELKRLKPSWAFTGDSIKNITLDPSIDCTEGNKITCKFHGHVKKGIVVW